MNTASKFEHAIKSLIEENSKTVQPAWFRTSYNNADIRNMTSSELFPQIFIQVSSPYMETEGTTWVVDFTIATATFFEDDINANINSNISGEVEKAMFGLINFRDETSVQYFITELNRLFEDETICYGGMTLSSGGYLTINDGALVSTLAGSIHYTINPNANV